MLDLFGDEGFAENLEARNWLAMADVTDLKMLKGIWNCESEQNATAHAMVYPSSSC